MRAEAALLVSKSLQSRTSDVNLNLIRDPIHKKQDAFVMDKNRFCTAQTTVRAGKSTALGIKYLRMGHLYKNVMMPYIALTRDSAKNIMWPILQEVSERLKIECDFIQSSLTCVIKKTGSNIKFFGADQENFMVRLKGIKTPFAAVDEAQDFRSHLEELVDILTARTSEYKDGQVCLTGTPGAVPKGYFYESSEGLHGFSVHKWSLFDNPYFPGARQFVDELIRRKAWPKDHPTLLRDFYGQWVKDLDVLVFQYDEIRNHFTDDPNLTDFIIGLDFGTDDADAIAVLGWHKHKRECYLVEEFIKNGLSVTEIVQEVDKLIKKYNPLKVVADTGANGKKIALEISKRTGVPIHAADKARKVEHITWLNDAFRTGLFYARRDSRFAQDCSIVEWDYDKSTSDKLVIKDDPHSDICDAVLYAYVDALAWLSEPAPRKINIKEQWVEHTQRLMEDAVENSIRKDKEKEEEDKFYGIQDPEDALQYYLNRRGK